MYWRERLAGPGGGMRAGPSMGSNVGVLHQSAGIPWQALINTQLEKRTVQQCIQPPSTE